MSEPLHFLEGLRCPSCKTPDASYLDPTAGLVECRECGQTALALVDPATPAPDTLAGSSSASDGTAAVTPVRRKTRSKARSKTR